MSRRIFPRVLLLLTCASAQAGDAKHPGAITQPQSLLEKVRAWQNAAEAHPKAIITLPRGTHPSQAPAKALAAHGAGLLRKQRGSLPKGADWAEFPAAVEIEVLHLAQQGKVDEAIKMLEWFQKSDGKYCEMAQWRIKHGGRL